MQFLVLPFVLSTVLARSVHIHHDEVQHPIIQEQVQVSWLSAVVDWLKDELVDMNTEPKTSSIHDLATGTDLENDIMHTFQNISQGCTCDSEGSSSEEVVDISLSEELTSLHRPNYTILDFLAWSKHHKIFYSIIKNNTELVKTLNDTSLNLTLFAPNDCALKRLNVTHIPYLEKTLYYHVANETIGAIKLLGKRTIDTLSKSSFGTQRIRVGVWPPLKPLNFYAGVAFPNIFTKNGVVHSINSLLLPPPPALPILEILPAQFSTSVNALYKTGLANELKYATTTFFVPTNDAWQKLGTKTLAFLFSSYGTPVLKKILEYHLVPNQVIYTDPAVVSTHGHEQDASAIGWRPKKAHIDARTQAGIIIGLDITSLPLVSFVKINNFPIVKVQNIPVYNGVLHALSSVIPPPNRRSPIENVSVDELKKLYDF